MAFAFKPDLMTAEQLAAPGVPDKFVELIDGELVSMAAATRRHNRIVFNLTSIFREFAVSRPELDYSGDNDGFLISRNPDTVLSPDACLFRARPDTGSTWQEFAPEIVAEVISPSNSKAEMAYKRQRFFAAGTEEFWIIEPEAQILHIFHSGGAVETFSSPAVVQCEGIARGLSLSLAELFRQK